jgi:uncharacterized membrane protein
MTKLHETVDIEAPATRVWAVVQEDVVNVPKWSAQVARVEKLDHKPPGVGTRYRYHLHLPGGLKESLEVEQAVYVKPKRCSGTFVRGPLKGTWAYAYSEIKTGTRVVYEMDYQLTGLLRLTGSLFAPQYAEGIRGNMAALKKYIESGKGPRR